MKLFRKIFARFRLKKIEKATGIKLKKWQKKIAINPDRPHIVGKRGSGKTTAAVFWSLLWWDKPISICQERTKLTLRPGMTDNYRNFAVPDPDIRDYGSLLFTLNEYNKYQRMCLVDQIQTADIKEYLYD